MSFHPGGIDELMRAAGADGKLMRAAGADGNAPDSDTVPCALHALRVQTIYRQYKYNI